MKEQTNKKPTQAPIDHDHGKSIYAQIAKRIASFRRSLESWSSGRHIDSRKCQRSENFIRKADAKKKRKRKLAYQSKRINRLRRA